MSETRDKRRKTDLDLFVLALIDSEVSTPYELQKAAGLSQGATIPALQRLLDARLVRQGKPGARGRTDYQATAAGKRLLKDGWRALIEEGSSGDIDSDLRVALLALLGGGDRRLAADFLRQSADKKMELVLQPSQWTIQLACLFSHGGTANCDPQPRKRCSRPNQRLSAPWPTLCNGSSLVDLGAAVALPRNRGAPEPVSKGSLGVLISWNR